jgi:RNA polymerase sigma factor (sigma-70 family)
MTTFPAPASRPSSDEAGGRVAALFDAHGRMILGLCRFLLRDADEADDATQQTFLSAYRSLLSGTEPRNPAQWLAEIARNECRGRIAARMREPLPLAATVEATGHDPADAADQTEVIDELKAAIAELPDRQREAVVLRDFYGLSYREVATAMTVSVPVVESLLFRARRRLDRRLGTLPRLAQGALAVPLALREELSRVIPGFDAAAASLGITGGGAAATGVVAKLAAMPATAKVASATTVAAVAVGGAAVTPQVIDRPPRPAKPAPTVTSPAASVPTPSASSGSPIAEARQKWDNRGRTRAKVGLQRAASGSAERKAAPELEEPSTESESSEAPEAETEGPAAETEAPEQEVEVEVERPAAAATPSPRAPQRVERETESEPRETEGDSADDAGSEGEGSK